jgi:tetratricopeptide (TPR) repeat protein
MYAYAEESNALVTNTAHENIRVNKKTAAFIAPQLRQAYLALNQGNYAEAQKTYQQVLLQDRRNLDALLGLAWLAKQQADNQLASTYYQRALVLEANNSQALVALARLQFEPMQRVSNLKQHLAQQPNSAVLQAALGDAYAEASRWSEAQNAYFEAYRLSPLQAQYVFNLAVSLDHLAKFQLALDYYQQALNLWPDKADGHAITLQKRIAQIQQLTELE